MVRIGSWLNATGALCFCICMSFGKETTHVSDSSTPNFAGPALGEAPLARQASAGATAAGALLDLDDDALALIAACVVPAALLPLQLAWCGTSPVLRNAALGLARRCELCHVVLRFLFIEHFL